MGVDAGGGTSGSAASHSGGTGSGGLVITGGTGSSGGGLPDVFPGDVVLADAALFDCGGCACDGSTHYCFIAMHPFRAPPPPDAALCEDAGSSCLPLPANCSANPTCGCIPFAPGCDCEDVGGGLQVFCYIP